VNCFWRAVMLRLRPQPLGVLLLALAIYPSARAQELDYQKSQFYKGITAHFTVTQEIKADIDKDGFDEAIVCYREPGEAVNQPGGVLILGKGIGEWTVAWHAFFENVYPQKVSASGGSITFDLVQTSMQESKTVSRTFVKDKDFFFRKEEGSPFYGAKVTASSTLKKEGIKPGNVFDQDLKTAWAEGVDGTGVDESISFEFKKPVDLGLIGVLHGNFKGPKEWKENNRLHRAEVTVETSSDRYDSESNVDFSSDLGLGLYGDKVEMTFSDKPLMRYFLLGKKNVLSVQLKITSVLLGEKNDDTFIAEVDFAEMITAAKIFGDQKAPSADSSKPKKEEKPVESTKESPTKKKSAGDWTEDNF
jgi:hypothetical protein